MRINFYDTRVENCRTVLIKEKAVNYKADDICKPSLVTKMLNTVVSLNVTGEEHCYMLALNNKGKLIGLFFISKGTVNMTCLNTREVFMRALLIGASLIILCHNHPSGDPEPSRQDMEITKKFKEVGEFLGIPLADHIIIGRSDYYSFMEKGLL